MAVGANAPFAPFSMLFIRENMAAITGLAAAAIQAINAAALGNADGAAAGIEVALCQAILLVIDLLLRLAGIDDKSVVKRIVDKIRAQVKKAFDSLIKRFKTKGTKDNSDGQKKQLPTDDKSDTEPAASGDTASNPAKTGEREEVKPAEKPKDDALLALKEGEEKTEGRIGNSNQSVNINSRPKRSVSTGSFDIVSGAAGIMHSPSQKQGAEDEFERDDAQKKTDGLSTKPLQLHHYATNKNKKYTPIFEQIVEKYNLRLDDDWNKEVLRHQGKHPNAYHDFVLENMRIIDKSARKFLSIRKEKNNIDYAVNYFKNNYEIKVKRPVRNNPKMLTKAYWDSI